ncbi:MAG: WSD1 family O-acyltransferase [Chloroflexota bacterium]|nr:WSD1 family O-acyltransferase [Chloroflexota bacterium]
MTRCRSDPSGESRRLPRRAGCPCQGGAPVLDLAPIQPLGRNVGLTFAGSSYAGCLTLAVRTDPDRFPDLDVLMAAMDRDWRTLCRSIAPGA